MKKTEYVAALRELADFVESKEFPDKWKGWWDGNSYKSFDAPKLSFDIGSKSDFGKISAVMGSFEKTRSDYYTGAIKKLPLGAIISMSAQRDVVCKKIVVGTRTIAAEPEQIIAAKPEREEDIVEWECPESFVALKDEEPVHANAD